MYVPPTGAESASSVSSYSSVTRSRSANARRNSGAVVSGVSFSTACSNAATDSSPAALRRKPLGGGVYATVTSSPYSTARASVSVTAVPSTSTRSTATVAVPTVTANATPAGTEASSSASLKVSVMAASVTVAETGNGPSGSTSVSDTVTSMVSLRLPSSARTVTVYVFFVAS